MDSIYEETKTRHKIELRQFAISTPECQVQKKLGQKPISTPKFRLVSRLPQNLWLFSALLTLSSTLQFSSSWAFFALASHFSQALSYAPQSSSPLPLLSPLLSRPGPFCWPCLVYSFLSLLRTLPDASGSSLPQSHNINLPLSHTSE